MWTTRSEFLAAFAATLAFPRRYTAASAPKEQEHGYIAGAASDVGADPVCHGYPDECFSFMRFADSLVPAAFGYGGYPEPPMVDLRAALAVDFCSATEAEAEAAIARGWSKTSEFPMGTASTIASKVAVNAQNERHERHITIIGTAIRQEEFCSRIADPLSDPDSYQDENYAPYVSKKLRGLAYVLAVLAEGTDQTAVHLFSRWSPSNRLRRQLASEGVELHHRPLREIPSGELAANRYYHAWTGTPIQAEEFLKVIWAPAWQRKASIGW